MVGIFMNQVKNKGSEFARSFGYPVGTVGFPSPLVGCFARELGRSLLDGFAGGHVVWVWCPLTEVFGPLTVVVGATDLSVVSQKTKHELSSALCNLECQQLRLHVVISCVISLMTRRVLPSGPGVYDQSLGALLTQPAASENESRVLGAVSNEEILWRACSCVWCVVRLGLAVELSPASYLEPRVDKMQPHLRAGCSGLGVYHLYGLLLAARARSIEMEGSRLVVEVGGYTVVRCINEERHGWMLPDVSGFWSGGDNEIGSVPSGGYGVFHSASETLGHPPMVITPAVYGYGTFVHGSCAVDEHRLTLILILMWNWLKGVCGFSGEFLVCNLVTVGLWLLLAGSPSYLVPMTRGMPPSDTSSSSVPQKALQLRVGVVRTV
ncbi:hypothetical protein Tco_0659690 [Tanacetum coccineum]